MSDRPIIFSAPMVRALLAGQKTQTRRIMKPQPSHDDRGLLWWRWSKYAGSACNDPIGGISDEWFAHLPWKLGDRLWVREACGRRPASFLGIEATNGVESAFYLADDEDVLEERGFNLCPWWKGKTSSPMLMPRRISRLTLTVTDVRVQRLQDISEEDAEAEGVEARPFPDPWWQGCRLDERDGSLHHQQSVGEQPPDWMIEPHPMASTKFLDSSARDEFQFLWNGLHGSDAWSANPWVAALTFTVAHGNIDALTSPSALSRAPAPCS